MIISRFIHCFCLIVTAHIAFAAEQEPPFFNATYKLFNSGLEIAQMERTLRQQENNEYIYSSTTETVGLVAMLHKDHIAEVSHWKLAGGRIIPLQYTYVRNGSRKDRRITIDFDWDKKVINNQSNERRRQMVLQIGIMDKLLYQYALMRDLLNNQAEMAYDVTDGGKMKKYNFEKLEEEIVHTPLGDLQTVKLHKIKHADKSKLIIWSAPALKYLPVKIESTDENGNTTTALIQTLTWM